MPSHVKALKSHLLLGAGLVALASAPGLAVAQDAGQTAAAPSDSTVVVVTGFRSSLRSALNIKRRSAGTVDAILAEDIAKFPDSNLAESMQRIPGVTLARGDGGEGRNISVRGLGPTFTRVRINGMEGASQTGSSDIYGAGNNGRSFDFNVFPTDIFSSLAARKTPSADIEEGSLGATVDLKAPRPFDYHGDQVLSMTARAAYNDVSKSTDPRFSLLAAKKFDGGHFGVLGSLTYQHRNTREVGYSAVDILSVGMGGNGVFCSPVGYTPVQPALNATKGTTADNCAFNNPRTSTLDAYNTVAGLRDPLQPNTPGSGAYIPRIPRFFNSTQDESRFGATLSLEWKPDDKTDIALDTIYTRYNDMRHDNYIEPISFARSISNNGQPMVSVKDVKFDQNGSLLYGLFDGVDVRSEGLVDRFSTTFAQVNLNLTHRFSDKWEIAAMIGASDSKYTSPLRLQTYMDAIDTSDFSLDFGGDNRGVPTIKFGGIDVNSVANFNYQPANAAGDVLGGFSLQGRPLFNDTANKTATFVTKYTANDNIAVRLGVEGRVEDFNSHTLNPIPGETATQTGIDLASITTTITGMDSLWGHGAPSSWVAIDSGKWAKAVGFDTFKYCGVECGAAKSEIKETTSAAFLMSEFHFDHWLPVPMRGDIGVRYVKTDQFAVGYIPVKAPSGSTYPTVGLRNEVKRSYDDVLPSMNLVFDLKPDLLLRVSAAKVMARPDLGALTPSSGVNGVTRTGSINNPYLDPIRAKTFDASLEWYFKPGSLLSAGYFYKDISSYIQKISSQVPFNTLGLPDSLLDGTNTAPTEIFTVTRLQNTPGGPLKGVELNLQTDFDFLPGAWKNVGVLANYTHVTSEIEYILTSSNGVPTSTTRNDLVGLSPDSASGTLYYEDKKVSIRATGTYRGRYIRGIPASTGSDLQGNAPTFYLDASASYNINAHLKLILDAQNLTDEMNRLYVDSTRQDTLFISRVGRTVSLGLTYKY
ncbi:MAG: TonB-dependent receptor [Asticcacaulis sp.]|uniref:TonB-dependent receptor n=1 Tax=Asticcacaulis sp. TaxID=1872648 RepID=UPI003F7B9C9C